MFSHSSGQRQWRALAVPDNQYEGGREWITHGSCRELYHGTARDTSRQKTATPDHQDSDPISQSAPQEAKCWTLLCFGLGYTHSSQFGVQKGSPTTPYSHSVGLYSLSCLTEPRRTSSVVNNTCHHHVNVRPTSEQLLGSKCTNSP